MKVHQVTHHQISDLIVTSSLSCNGSSEFSLCYEHNRKVMKGYKFWRSDPLPEFQFLPIIPGKLSGEHYTYYDKEKKSFGETLRIYRSNEIEHSFFSALDKPLFIKNEFNLYHLEYLFDNVRSSEDYGGDNHIYLWYRNLNEFLLFLCAKNISDLLAGEKFVFVFGEEEEGKYTIDYKREYGIDYDSKDRQPVRVKEIHRIFVNLGYLACSGNSFFMGILDFHKDVLSVKGFDLADFVFIYRISLRERTVDEFEQSFFEGSLDKDVRRSFERIFDRNIYGTECNCPTPEKFFQYLKELFEKHYKPTESEWLKGIFLAYAVSLGRSFNGRIVPGIKFETHWNVKFSEETNRWKYNRELFHQFKYHYEMIPLRYPIQAAASMAKKWTVEEPGVYNHLDQIPNSLMGEYKLRSIFQECKNHSSKSLVILRLEDFKRYPMASLESLCEYLDIPWDDMLLRITGNGQDYIGFGTKAFDASPLGKYYYEIANPFDYYRVEVVMSGYWRHFGYSPLFYKENITYTKEELIKMFELPFQGEAYNVSDGQKARTVPARKAMLTLLEKRLGEGDAPLDDNGEEMVPIPCLKPKGEFAEER